MMYAGKEPMNEPVKAIRRAMPVRQRVRNRVRYFAAEQVYGRDYRYEPVVAGQVRRQVFALSSLVESQVQSYILQQIEETKIEETNGDAEEASERPEDDPVTPKTGETC